MRPNILAILTVALAVSGVVWLARDNLVAWATAREVAVNAEAQIKLLVP